MINTSELDTHYMRQALRQAQKAYEANEVPVGALAVLDKRILGQAYNQTMLLKDPTAHAEILAKTQAAGALGKERLDGVTVYVTIEPCPMCLGAMIQARIARLVFGAREPKTGACGSVVNLMAEAKWNHRFRIVEGVLEFEAAALMQEFFKNKRKIGPINQGGHR